MSVHQTHRKTPKRVYAWRFATGQSMSGVRKTNATFLYRATRDLTDHGHASRWSHRAGWERAAWRLGASAITLAVLYGYLTDRTATRDSVLAALAALTVASIVRARYALASARHHKRVVRPLWETTTLITGTSVVHGHAHGDSHKRYITVPRNYRDPKARVRLTIPATWEAQPGAVTRLNDLVARRLGGEWDAIPHFNAFPPYIDFVPSPSPPGRLTFAEIREAMEAGNQNTLIIGKGTHDKIVSIDLDSDAPHVALSMGTGGGKSSLLRLFVAYLIRHGVERVDIIDPKRVSHNWARNIPGVYIHRTMAEQMTAVADFRKRMEDRYEELDHDENRVFPRHVLVVEEQNSFLSYAKMTWEDYRASLEPSERAKVPRANPVIGNLAYCLFQGRQARMNIISVYQRMSASAAGGGDMRENYGARVLSRYSAQTWKMLVGTTPVPRSSRIPGRGRYVLGDLDAEVQFAFITDAEAVEYAMLGAKTPATVQGTVIDPLMAVPAGPETGQDDEPAMTLRELCETGIVPMRYSAAKRARTRAGDMFPAGETSPVGTVYRPSDVLAWHESRGTGGPKLTVRLFE